MAQISPKSTYQRGSLDKRVNELKNRFESVRHLPIDDDYDHHRSIRGLDTFQAPFIKALSQIKVSPKVIESDINHNRRLSRWTKVKTNLSLIVDISKKNEHPDNNISTIESSIENRPLDDANVVDGDMDDEHDMESYWKNFHLPSIANIDDVTLQGLGTPRLPSYKEDLDKAIEESGLTINKVPESIIQAHQHRLEEKLIHERQVAVDRMKVKEIDILWREHLARERLIAEEKKNQEKIEIEREMMMDDAVANHSHMEHQFKHAREDLEYYLKQQHARIQDKFGEISYADMSLGRTLEATATGLPQPLEIRIHFLRAVKSKLPKGAYVMLISQYDSLGGKPLWWSKIGPYGIDETMPGVTKPIKHYGRYFDRIMKFEDSLYTLCPPRNMLKPSHCLILEIFQLANRINPYDKCVGWTAVPMCNEHYGLVEGKLKLPMMRGEHTPNCQHYRKMESSITKDLNNWLCNIYIEMRRLPVDALKHKMDMSSKEMHLDYLNHAITTDTKNILRKRLHEVKKHLSSSSHVHDIDSSTLSALPAKMIIKTPLVADKGLYRRVNQKTSPDHINSHDDHHDDDDAKKLSMKPVSPSKDKKGYLPISLIYQRIINYMHIHGQPSASILPAASSHAKGYEPDIEEGRDDYHNHNVASSSKKHKHDILNDDERSSSAEVSDLISNHADDHTISHHNDVAKSQMITQKPSHQHFHDDPVDIYERGYNSEDDFYLDDEQRGKLAGIESIDDPIGKQYAQAMIEGKVVRRYQSDGPRFDAEAIPTAYNHDDKTLIRPTSKYSNWKKLEDFRDVETFTMSIASDPSQRRRLLPKVIQRSKLRFLSLELFGEFSWYKLGSFTFYLNLVIFIIALWMRIYVHFIAQYLFLRAASTPVYSFIPYVTTISFKYMSTSVSVATEVGAISIGPTANIIMFITFGITGKLFYQVAGFMLDSLSNFIAYYGLVCICDPIFIMIIDVIVGDYNCSHHDADCSISYTSKSCHCYEGDFIKLYNRFVYDEDSGVSGIIITVIIYIACMTISSLLLYEYLVYVHRDARILDLYRRINAPAEEFFLPDDYEISAEELVSICAMAQRWRGLDGSRRKVHISTFTDHNKQQHESIKHYAIYNYDINGSRGMIHRHFIMLEDGIILEIFEQFHHQGTKSEAYAAGDHSRKALEAMLQEEDHRIQQNILQPVHVNQDVLLKHPGAGKQQQKQAYHDSCSPKSVSFDVNGAVEASNLFAGFEKS